MSENRSQEETWLALATRSGRVSLASLTSKSDDGLDIGPLYRAGDGSPLIGHLPGTPWVVSQRISDWNGEAPENVTRRAVEGGANGMTLVYPDSATARGRGVDFAIEALRAASAVAGVDHLRLDCGEETAHALGDRLANLIDADSPEICVAFDPIATFAARGAISRSFDAIFETISTLVATMNTRDTKGEAVIADGRPWHDAGATEAQELAVLLAAAVAYLRTPGENALAPDAITRRLGFVLSADTDQFLTIAKIRALRLLLARFDEITGLTTGTCRIHAETSWRMMCRRDPYLNILRTTGATLAAATAGVDSLTVLPFDLGNDPFADRIARNVQTISRDEAALFRFSDPGAGSGAIEALTTDLAATAWADFQAIEAEGGILESVRSGAIQKRIAASRRDRSERVARRAIEIVGVNAHVDMNTPQPDRLQQVETDKPSTSIETTDRLESMRLAEVFENLCDRAEVLKKAGSRPLVFLAGIGAPDDFSVDAVSVKAALATGGLEATDTVGFETPEAAEAAFRASNACLACILSSSDAFGAATEALASALRSAGARRILVWRQGDQTTALPPSVDDALGPRVELAAVLAKLLDAVADREKNGQNHATQKSR